MAEVTLFGQARKPNGYFIFTDVETRKVTEYYSAQCKHCGMHWQVVPGSGRKRGWCIKCMGLTCGGKNCRECFPIEARLEAMEGNKKTMRRYTDVINRLSYLPSLGGGE